MLEDRQIHQPFEKRRRAGGGVPSFEALEEAARRDREERRRLRWLAFVAAAFHAVLLVVSLPEIAARPSRAAGRQQPVFVVQQVRFKPPAPKQARQQVQREKKVKRIPIPDPTPDDPEPIYVESTVEVPEDVPLGEVDYFEIPDAPGVGGPGPPGDVFQVGNGVSRPVKVYAPQPLYTEEARASRIQGSVILQAIVNADGTVSHVQVLKGLPLGLSESAIETVATWRYEPARRDGQPVAVHYVFTVNFSLQ